LIYCDKTFIANIEAWKTLGIPYVAQSESTNYALLGTATDIVIDFDLDIPGVKMCGFGDGLFNVVEEAAKASEAQHAAELEETKRRQQQALDDGGAPKLVEDDDGGDGTIPTTVRDSDLRLDEDIGGEMSTEPLI